jgi:hypothetical protein
MPRDAPVTRAVFPERAVMMDLLNMSTARCHADDV